ncbi:MAG: hypothetical protein R3C68_06445 [Myxococcota bacterium]
MKPAWLIIGMILLSTLAVGCTETTCETQADCASGQTCSAEGKCTDGPLACAKDFDCPVGQACGGEDVCISAGAERQFGEATLVAQSTDDVFLVAVYDQPTEAASVNGFATFTLSTPTGTLGFIKHQPRRQFLDPQDWAARSAFARQQRAQLDAVVEDLRAGQYSTRPFVAKQAACSCSAVQMCWKGSCVDSDIDVKFIDGTTVTCDLLSVVNPGINVLVDQAAASNAGVLDAVEAFAESWGTELGLLGQTQHNGYLDRDGDGRLNIVFTNRNGGGVTDGVVGFFHFGDFLPSGTSSVATGNTSDILWAKLPGASGVATTVGTLVHEYTHLVSYAVRVHARDNQALREVCGSMKGWRTLWKT